MKLQIAKLRLFGIITFAAFLFLIMFEFKQLANFSLMLSSWSFLIIIVLHIYVSFKSGFLKEYTTYNRVEDEI